MRKQIFCILKNKFMQGFLFCIVLLFYLDCSVYARNITVVIDPGHGGDNLGGVYEKYTEKEMTMPTALAMKEHLEEFENVTVFLTHESITEPDMSLEERADYAASLGADFLFSLHYNKSEDHRLYGTEVWTSAFDEYYEKGTAFGEIAVKQLTDSFDLFDRGVKTRLNSRGSDYYGIIRQGRKDGLPTVIIEHCHMDQANDRSVLLSDENIYEQFGIADAEAVAKYFQLRSESLQEDYTRYPVPDISFARMLPADTTPPETAAIAITGYDDYYHLAEVTLTAKDSGSSILYYDISLDGGLTYGCLYPFITEDFGDSCSFYVPQKEGQTRQLVCRVYNRYDKGTASNTETVKACYRNK